jgi:hypothetical protein
LNIYDYKNSQITGEINHLNFVLNKTTYNVNKRTKSIFNKAQLSNFRFEIYNIYTSIISFINVNIIKEKWYHSKYDVEINGSLEIPDESSNEFILCTFLYLHTYIETERRD